MMADAELIVVAIKPMGHGGPSRNVSTILAHYGTRRIDTNIRQEVELDTNKLSKTEDNNNMDATPGDISTNKGNMHNRDKSNIVVPWHQGTDATTQECVGWRRGLFSVW